MKRIIFLCLFCCVFCAGCGQKIWVPVETCHSYDQEAGPVALEVDFSDAIVGSETLSVSLENQTTHVIGHGALPFSVQKWVEGAWCELERTPEATTEMWYGILPGEAYQAEIALEPFVGKLQAGTYRVSAAFFPTEDAGETVYLYTELNVTEP